MHKLLLKRFISHTLTPADGGWLFLNDTQPFHPLIFSHCVDTLIFNFNQFSTEECFQLGMIFKDFPNCESIGETVAAELLTRTYALSPQQRRTLLLDLPLPTGGGLCNGSSIVPLVADRCNLSPSEYVRLLSKYEKSEELAAIFSEKVIDGLKFLSPEIMCEALYLLYKTGHTDVDRFPADLASEIVKFAAKCTSPERLLELICVLHCLKKEKAVELVLDRMATTLMTLTTTEQWCQFCEIALKSNLSNAALRKQIVNRLIHRIPKMSIDELYWVCMTAHRWPEELSMSSASLRSVEDRISLLLSGVTISGCFRVLESLSLLACRSTGLLRSVCDRIAFLLEERTNESSPLAVIKTLLTFGVDPGQMLKERLLSQIMNTSFGSSTETIQVARFLSSVKCCDKEMWSHVASSLYRCSAILSLEEAILMTKGMLHSLAVHRGFMQLLLEQLCALIPQCDAEALGLTLTLRKLTGLGDNQMEDRVIARAVELADTLN